MAPVILLEAVLLYLALAGILSGSRQESKAGKSKKNCIQDVLSCIMRTDQISIIQLIDGVQDDR